MRRTLTVTTLKRALCQAHVDLLLYLVPDTWYINTVGAAGVPSGFDLSQSVLVYPNRTRSRDYVRYSYVRNNISYDDDEDRSRLLVASSKFDEKLLQCCFSHVTNRESNIFLGYSKLLAQVFGFLSDMIGSSWSCTRRPVGIGLLVFIPYLKKLPLLPNTSNSHHVHRLPLLIHTPRPPASACAQEPSRHQISAHR